MSLNLFDSEIADLEATIAHYQQRLEQARTTQAQADETLGNLEAVVSSVATHPHALEALKQSVLNLFGITLPKDPPGGGASGGNTSAKQKPISVQERNALVQQNLNLCRKVAREYSQRCRESYEDLEQISYLGLIRAVERFDKKRGAAFSSFAMPFIKGAILHHLRDNSHLVKIPRSWQEIYQKVQRAAKDTQKCADAVAIDMELDSDTWSQIKRAMQGWVLELNDEICDRATDSASFYEVLERQELRDAVAQLALPLQQVIDFVYFQRFSIRQAAKALDCKVQQVKENLDKAIALLGEKLVDQPQMA